MRKNIFYLTTLAIIMLLGACSNEPLFDETGKGFLPGAERLISLTATMPNDGPTTRVALEQKEDLSVALTWEEGDQLQLVFVQGDIKVKKDVTVGEISSDGKNASFEIIIPAEITENFDLYGVYGGGGLSNEDPTVAILPAKAGETGTLESIEEQEHVMFYFASKDMKVAYSEPTVLFKNFGSLFSITLQNSGSASLDDLAEARLVGVGGDGKWAYNIGEGGGTYNLITGEFQNTEEADNYISFKAEKASLAEGESMTFWGWYPPLPGKVWPALELQLLKEDGSKIAVSTNTMEERTEETAPGMSYYFNAEWDGSALGFGMTKGPHIFVKVDGEATNDGSSWAQATTLTTALELMEEGDEIHIAAGTYVPTNMVTGGEIESDKTFEINKNVTLTGGYPADASEGAIADAKVNKTLLSGKLADDANANHVVTVTAPKIEGQKVVINGLTISHGKAFDRNNKIIINEIEFPRGYGGGMSIGNAIVDVIDTDIVDNGTIYDTSKGGFCAGVFIHNKSIVTFRNSKINDNVSTGNGGGLWVDRSVAYIYDSEINRNTGGTGAGAHAYPDAEIHMYNSTVSENQGNSYGAGFYARQNSKGVLVNCLIDGNETSSKNGGGGVMMYSNCEVDLISTTIVGNKVLTGPGAGVYRRSGVNKLGIYNTIISGNISVNDGPDVDIYASDEISQVIKSSVLGAKSYNQSGVEVADITFDFNSMLDASFVPIGTNNPAIENGMNVTLLQTLASEFTPPIDNDIISKDIFGNSRSDKAAMGAVVSDGSEPVEPTLPKADMFDIVFNEDGTAKDVSPMSHPIIRMIDEKAPATITYNDSYKLNVVNFNPEENGVNPAEGEGTCYYIDYTDNTEFQNKLANGHSFECLVKFDVDYTIERSYETKFFSTHQSGGTGFLIAKVHDSGTNGLTFLPNVPATDEGGSTWIWTNSQVRPDGQSWYHLVGVWDKEAGKSIIYVDGVKKAEVDADGFYRPASLDPLWLTVGGDPGKFPQLQAPFKGSIGIARVYDKALTQSEVNLLWNEVK